MGKIKIKVNKKVAGAFKAVGQNIVKSGKNIASAGKALGKCKVGDVKCAAKGVANMYLAGAKLVVSVSPAGAAYVATNDLSGGKVHKGLTKVSKSVIGVDPADLASGDISRVGKAVGKAAYKVSGAETLVTAGKALAKCKPKDAACIAKNLGQIGSVALMYVPGAGGAARIAMNVAKTAVKGAVQKEVEALARKKLAEERKKRAEKKLREAANDQEKQAAQAEVEASRQDVTLADQQVNAAMNEKMAAEKQLSESATVVLQQNAAEKAFNEQKEYAAKYPEIAEKLKAGVDPNDKTVFPSAPEEKKYFGIGQSKLIMGAIALFFLIITILILKP